MINAIIGYTGFVGSYLWENLPDADLYNSKNLKNILYKQYKTIYFAGLPSTKWLINKFPYDDIKNIIDIQNCLTKVKSQEFILISTIDIYNNNQPYGRHRLDFEKWVLEQKNLGDVRIIRLPALFGHGLKKNIIYDYLNDKELNVHPHSEFQWYNMENLWNDIQNKNKIVELYTEPLKTFEFIPRLDKNNNLIKYDHKPCNGYIEIKENVLKDINEYIRLYRIDKTKLTVSNLMWDSQNDNYALSILKRYGIQNIELVPTKYFDGNWDVIFENAKYIKEHYKDFNLVSMQCIFYNIQGDLNTNYSNMLFHIIKVMNFANELGIKRIIFGSPKIRSKKEIFIEFLKNVATYSEIIWDGIICIEPNSKSYGCVTGINFKEVLDIVREVNHRCIQINYDTGNAIIENDKYYDLDYIKHVQVSMPYLKDLDNNDIDRNFIKSFKDTYISLEVKETKNIKTNIKRFVELFL